MILDDIILNQVCFSSQPLPCEHYTVTEQCFSVLILSDLIRVLAQNPKQTAYNGL